MTLKVAAIRGVESRGMMCSARELELGEDHDGIIELPADAPVGAAFADYAGLDDPVFDVAITPNRQDCMGVRGIARDLAAAGIGHAQAARRPADRGQLPVPGAEFAIEDPDGCPAFFGRRDPRRDQRGLARSGCSGGSRRRASGRSRRWSTSPIT